MTEGRTASHPPPAGPRTTFIARALALLTAACLASALGGCKLRFGGAGRTPFVAGVGVAGSPCGGDETCGGTLQCCAGRCASCCADVDCPVLDPCRPPACIDGSCRADAAFVPPRFETELAVPERGGRVLLSDDTAILVSTRAILLADLRGPGRPRLVGSQSFAGRVLQVSRAGDLLAVMVDPEAELGPEIHLVDLSIERWPRVAVVATLADLRAMSMSANLLAAAKGGELFVVDASRPAEPRTISSLPIDCARPVAVHSSRNRVAVACGDEGVVIVSVEDPAAPEVVEAVAVAGASAVAGTRPRWAVQGGDAGGVLLLEHGEVGAAGGPGATLLACDGRRLVLAEGHETHVIDLEGGDLTRIEGASTAAALDDDRLLLSGRGPHGGVELFVPSDGQAAQTVARMDLAPFVGGVDADVRGDRAVAAYGGGALVLADVSRPGSPHVVGSIVHERALHEVALVDPWHAAVVEEGGSVSLVHLGASAGGATRSWSPPGGARVIDVAIVSGSLLVTDTSPALTLLAHAGLEHLEVLDRMELEEPSRLLAGEHGATLVPASGGGVVRVVPVDAGGVSLLAPGPPLSAWPGPLAVGGGLVADVPPEHGGALRLRRIDGSAPPAWLEDADCSALAFARDRLLCLGGAGLLTIDVEGGALRVVEVAHAGRAAGAPELMPFTGGVAAATGTGLVFAETTPSPVRVVDRSVSADTPAGAALAGGQLVVAAGAAGTVVWEGGRRESPWPGCARDVAIAGEVTVTASCHGGLAANGSPLDGPRGSCDALLSTGGAVLARCAGEQGARWWRVDEERVEQVALSGCDGGACVAGSTLAETCGGCLVLHDLHGARADLSFCPDDLVQVDDVAGAGVQDVFAVVSGTVLGVVDARGGDGARIAARLELDLAAPVMLEGAGRRVYAVGAGGGAVVVDLDEPAAPVIGAELDTGLAPACAAASPSPGGPTLAVLGASGRAALLGDGEKARLADVVVAPRLVTHLDGRTYLAAGSTLWRHGGGGLELPGEVRRILSMDGRLVAVLASGAALALLSMDGEGDPHVQSFVELPGPVVDAAAAVRAVCAVSASSGLWVVDLDAEPPTLVTAYEQSSVLDVAARDRTCWVLLEGSRLAPVGVVDPSSPRPEPGVALDAEGVTRLWNAPEGLVAGAGPGILLVDVTGTPTVVHRVELPQPIVGAWPWDGLVAAQGSSTTWLVSWDGLGDGPALLGALDGPWGAGGLVARADEAVAAGAGAVWNLDVGCLVHDSSAE